MKQNSQLPIHQLLAAHWGITVAESTLLGGELDRTYRVVATDGATYSVKERSEANAEVALELGALTHLARHNTQANAEALAIDTTTAVRVPAVVPTQGQQPYLAHEGGAVWVLEWLEGQRWADQNWRAPVLARSLGSHARTLSTALQDFDHPAAHRTHHWDVRNSAEAITQHRDQAVDDSQQQAITWALRLLANIEPLIASLPHSVVHQDLNDHNVVVRPADIRSGTTATIAGVIDFGDLLHSATITELVVAVAYAMLRTDHPIDTAAEVVAGWYGSDIPGEHELDVIFPLALGRLLVNALTWSARSETQPEYAHARSQHTWATIEKLQIVPAAVARERFRLACDRSACIPLAYSSTPAPSAETSVYGRFAVIDLDPRRNSFDSIDPTDLTAVWQAESARGTASNRAFAIGHDTVRLDRGGYADGAEGPATIQLGVELHNSIIDDLVSPVSGVVVSVDADRLVIAHDSTQIWSHWLGLAPLARVGDQVKAGDPIGRSLHRPTGHPAPVTVQLLRFRPETSRAIPRFIRPTEREAWAALSIDPHEFLGLRSPTDRDRALTPLDDKQVQAQRNRRLASSQRYYYQEPMTLVRAHGVTFVDAMGRHYLDAINNVTHVGHGNPRVVSAAERQMRRLNTNSRFVYQQMGDYADRLASLLPDPLEVVFLVCTGSEANDLALRIARQVTGRADIMVVDGAYHGNTTAVTGISPNRYKGAGGQGPPPTTHEVEQPNRYRGRFGFDDPEAGRHYAQSVRDVAQHLQHEGRAPAAFIAESLMGTAGQVVYPPDYLATSFDAVRSVGGLCISDEVQVGFGRLGTHFWGFEQAGVVPDIVTMGKPMGNGHPIAAVVTTRPIADAFDQGMKYFNTFGGNPVSCAIADAVLDEIEDRGLQQHALHTGARFLQQLEALQAQHPVIGDVRGEGLYLGVEFVGDPATKAPLPSFTSAVCERMRQHGVIVYPNGVHANCLKIKPPMPFDDTNTDQFVDTLDVVLRELSS